MTYDDYARLTGITKDQFNIVHKSLSSLRSTSSRSIRTALAVLLVKLRTGLSLAVLSTVFGVKKITCSMTMHYARVSFMSNNAPKYLSLSQIERTKVCEDHTTNFARVFFADSKTNIAIAVADDTYVYIVKVVITHFKGGPILFTKVVHWLNQCCLWRLTATFLLFLDLTWLMVRIQTPKSLKTC